MENPAISVSNSLHFLENFLEKPKTHLRVLGGKTPLCCKTNKNGPSVLVMKEKRSGSVLTSFAVKREEECFIDLKDGNGWIHFVGVGGCGLSALAMLALKQGFEVSGSDIVWSSYMDGLQKAGAHLYIGHSVSNIQRNNGSRFPNAIVVSSAIPQDNVEIKHAKSVGVPVYKRDYWLGKLTEPYNLIAVSGSHGKSTTASMLAYVLKAMGDDLTAVVGAHVPQFPCGNIVCGDGRNFVLEADEYDGCFLGLSPCVAVVMNLDWEHVDIFRNEEAVKSIFGRFLKQIRVGGHLIICGDSFSKIRMVMNQKDLSVRNNILLHLVYVYVGSLMEKYHPESPEFYFWALMALGGYSLGANSLLNHVKQASESEYSSPVNNDAYRITTFGISSINEWHASSIHPNSRGGNDYILCRRGCALAEISLQIPGVHNIVNSLAVIATVLALVSDRRQIYESIDCVKLHLNNFIGVSRRFEMIGTIYGCHIYDDYAHHPTEVCAVLQAARQRFPSKALLVVFEPHTYSRLAALKDDFATALSYADHVVVTAVYAARETNVWNVSGRDLASAIVGPPSEYIPSLRDVVDKLVLHIAEDPHSEIVVLTLGAGDITTVGRKLLHELQKRLQKVKLPN